MKTKEKNAPPAKKEEANIVNMDYIKTQAELLFRQWEFYEHLTWQIPTAAITMNGAVFALSKILEYSPKYLSLALALTGLLTIAMAYRLHRASQLSRVLLHELRDKFDEPYGIKNIQRMTDQITWSFFTSISSRMVLGWVLFLWGVFMICLSLNVIYTEIY